MKKQTFIGVAYPIAISIIGLLSVAFIAMSLHNGAIPLWAISESKLLNFTFTMQLMVLPISLVAIVIMRISNKESFEMFFRLGTVSGSVSSPQESNWRLVGPLVAVAFTLGTLAYMSPAVMTQKGQMNEYFVKLLPLVILFAATNAWTEEILSRFVLVSGLYGKVNANAICWISAILFGLGHYFGTPNGIFGVIASGGLGWLLAKSVVETKALGWALFIHFLQDIVIFGAGAMVLAGQR